MNGAIVISWGNSVRGREAKGMEVFGKALGYYDDLAKAGRIHGHREFFGLTGKSRGFMVIDGEVAELFKLQSEDESIKLQTQAAAIVDDFQVEVYAGGNEATTTDMVGRYVSDITELGYF